MVVCNHHSYQQISSYKNAISNPT